ncbi:MAG TPA: ABC transporter permease [Gemmatimonadaceae bacterium]
MGSFFLEVRSAARSLARVPTVTISAILCLALGLGATTAIASAINRALLQPAPFRDPGRLVAVHRITPNSGPQGTWPQSVPNYLDLARDARLVEGLSAMSSNAALLQLGGEALRVSRMVVTGNLFATLGVSATRGRLLIADDSRRDQPPVVVVSDEFWRIRLGADPAIVGRSMSIDGTPATVVGVLPPDFRIPHGGNVLRADLWMPARFTDNQLAQRRSNFLLLLGRLAPGATVALAEDDMRRLFSGLVENYPQLTGENVRVAPLQSENVASIRTPLLLIFAAVGMVLLIAATNVAALLLARGVQKQREVAVRSALGAGAWDTMRPALMESLLIAVTGAALGLALAAGGVRTIGALAATRMRQLEGLSMDWRVIAFGVVLAIVVALLCGAVPAWRTTTVDPQDALRAGRGGGAGRGHHRALRTLVVLEVALSLVLLIGAGLVLKGFSSLLRNDPGFETSSILTLRATVSSTRYASGGAVPQFLEPALEAVRAVPGVEAAAAITLIPYVNWGSNSNIRYEGVPGDNPTNLPLVEQRVASPEFFAVTQQRLVSGRLLRASDDNSPSAPPVVVVNQALAERDFPGRDPVGQRFHTSDTTFATIVGVVSNVRNVGPIQPPAAEMYWTYRQAALGSTAFPLMIRVRSGNPMQVLPAVRNALQRVDATAALSDVLAMDDVITQSLGRPRFYFALLGTFAAIALVLALAGLYGVLSYAVAQRTREIGIRAALGSPRAALMRLVTAEGLRLVAMGVVGGLMGGFAVTRLMTFMLYGVSPLDPLAWVAAVVLMVVAAILAALLPARRAARVDPLIAMRTE